MTHEPETVAMRDYLFCERLLNLLEEKDSGIPAIRKQMGLLWWQLSGEERIAIVERKTKPLRSKSFSPMR